MPLLYALPITLAVVGTIAVTLLVVEVIVPALLLQDPHQDRGRRGRQRRRRPVLVQASTRVQDQGEGIVSTRVAARSTEDYGYEIRKRRPAANRRQQQQQQHREVDQELHVLGEVTASEYELANDDSSLNLATNPSPSAPSRSPPPYPFSAIAIGGERTEDQRPLLLLFEEEGEEEELAAAAGGDGDKLDPSHLEQDGTMPVAASSVAAVHPDLSSGAAPEPVVDDGSAEPVVEAAATSSSSSKDLPVAFARGQIAPNSNAVSDSEAASSFSPVVQLVSLGPPPPAAAVRHRDHEQNSSTKSDTPDSVDWLHEADATAAADWTHRHPLASPLSSSTAALATSARSATPSSSDLDRVTSSSPSVTAASPIAPNTMVDRETGTETGFSSPEFLSMSRSTSQSGSVVSAGEEAARSEPGDGAEEEEEEDASSSWTRVSSPSGFTSLSSDDNEDDDVGDTPAQTAQL
ncbi:hypothetical protein C6P46_001046 [Rhodotorula mucilaginosa]|uniref:Uncharacterized protein n=1 Tax=Rhodotorula mucilaginosa TaxID=5537 RepID=A0A9P6VVZ6_RHOMI|nr:hypothetical protein C6P46_001046 [Rhodotorula mucilaginosa]